MFCLSVKFFSTHLKMAHVFQCENIRKQAILKIFCNMGFEDKTYGLNPLVVH
jgi:hypothetical protein